MLDVKNLQKAYGPQVLLDDVTFTVSDGEKVGVIGANGTGKSTLFRVLVGLEPADEGAINLGKGQRIGFLEQDPQFGPEATARSVVAGAISEIVESMAAYERVGDAIATGSGDLDALLVEQAELQERIERLDGWNHEHKVETVLHQLRIAESDMDRPVRNLSGGQRRRVALARLLLERPDVLILDEPTNHLDADTVEWLEPTLIAYEGAVLLVTHDRYFLEHVVTRILELDGGVIRNHPGNYSVYMERKLERLRTLEVQQDRRANILSRELAWLSRGVRGRGTKARGRIKQVHNVQADSKQAKRVLNQQRLQMTFAADGRHGRLILEVSGVRKTYKNPEGPDNEVLKGISFNMRQGDKLAIVGPNGAGKSTMIEALLGQYRADKFAEDDDHAPLSQRQAKVPERRTLGISLDGGEVRWGKNVRIAYMGQGRDDLDEDATVYDALGEIERITVGDRKVNKRTFLQEFLFDYGAQKKRVSALSGGERCRLILAKIITENANFIILDEPTNDLDIDSLQVLEDALSEFPGCALIVTHDRYFINRVSNAILAMEDGQLTRYDGDWQSFRDHKEAERKAAAARVSVPTRAAATAPAAETSEEAPQTRKLSYKEREELGGMEARILEAEARKEAVEATLADPETYKSAGPEVAQLTQQLATLSAEIEALYARWEHLEGRA